MGIFTLQKWASATDCDSSYPQRLPSLPALTSTLQNFHEGLAKMLPDLSEDQVQIREHDYILNFVFLSRKFLL